jgi:hypothetical protein
VMFSGRRRSILRYTGSSEELLMKRASHFSLYTVPLQESFMTYRTLRLFVGFTYNRFRLQSQWPMSPCFICASDRHFPYECGNGEVMRGRDVLFREPIIEKAQLIKSSLHSDQAGCDRSSAR